MSGNLIDFPLILINVVVVVSAFRDASQHEDRVDYQRTALWHRTGLQRASGRAGTS
jgi:hypothetical protein